ncbi:MAG: hypothetical protein WCA77_06260 [Thermoplasmata archaeon]
MKKEYTVVHTTVEKLGADMDLASVGGWEFEAVINNGEAGLVLIFSKPRYHG